MAVSWRRRWRKRLNLAGIDIQFLLAAGARMHSKRISDALEHAAVNGNLDTMTALLDAGAPLIDHALCWAGADDATAALLLARGANVHHDHDAALRYAASFGQLEMVTLLLDNGANPHAMNDSALQEAQLGGYTAVATLLLERG